MHVVVARLDNDGDVLLTGPAVRAVAASGADVTYLCRPAAAGAAALLPGVTGIRTFEAPWISAPAPPVDAAAVGAFVADMAALAPDQAVIMTSFHQSPLPLALLLRLAGVPCIAAISEDYPGTLLDVRHRVPDDRHEVERNLSLVATLGYHLPAGDERRLAIVVPPGAGARPSGEYVVIHPGASVPARSVPAALAVEVATAVLATGRQVVITGGGREWAADWPWPDGTINLAGATDLPALAGVLAGATAVVVGNTGPAHLAAAVGTPVVSVFAPTVPLAAWHPWGVPVVVVGDQDISCRHCRSRSCPILGQPCTAAVSAGDILAALDQIAPTPRAAA
ncbi:MAG TPA: glycosyltransferase family 9 protein [Acidimicrobiales bacterium]|nr:glycosyltransferase family 9 protein [Acidimicrobiales bacterium]